MNRGERRPGDQYIDASEFPEGLTQKDIELIIAQCEMQDATKREQILGFATAYREAKELAHDDVRLRALTSDEVADLIIRWATLIEPRNIKGLRTTSDVLRNGMRL